MTTAAVVAGAMAGPAQAAFDNGAIYVLRVGDGSTTNFNGTTFYAAGVAIDEYSATTGSLLSVQSLASSGGSALTLSTNSGDDSGRLNFSGDGNYLTLGGYRQDAGNTGADPGVSTTVPRVIGRVSSNGAIDTSTALSGIYTGTAITSVVSANGTTFYAGGSNSSVAGSTSGGLQFINAVGATATAANVGANPATDSFRNVRLIDGTVYVQTPSSSTNRGVYRANLGGATTYSPIIVNLTGSAIDANGNNDSVTDGSGKLYPKSDIHFFDTNGDGIFDTAYSTGGKSDLEKWTLTGGAASSNATLGSTWSRTSFITLNSKVDINSLDAVQDGSNVDLFLSSDLGIYKLIDTGGGGALMTTNVTPTASYTNTTSGVVETSGTYTGNYFISVVDANNATGFSQFRGLAVTAVPEPVGLVAMAGVGVAMRRRSRRA